ncbi:MAG: FecR domain-containing protein, partial [Acidobacteriaceae bacterium]|nr:FecR domain-containing protein [Acidobacteriaceae bacterium]
MNRLWQTAARMLAGITVAACCATPQGYTISARPGALNYVEGDAFINGAPVSNKGVRSTFLNANDTLSTDAGKAELLLTPGVFLRIGDNSAVKMIAPSLTNTQVEVTRGEAMLEVTGLVKDNEIQVFDRNGAIRIEKDGLYRFSADEPPTAAVLEGKAEVSFEGRRIQLGKGHETVIGPELRAEKFDLTRNDDLYAWSNVRSQYDAASSYQAAKSVPINNTGGWWGYGYGGWYSPGWFWNGAFDSWAWLPAYGAFYSPFGWGFYAPGIIAYAPVVYVPVSGGGGTTPTKPNPKPTPKPVPVNPKQPPAVGAIAASPAAYAAARVQAAHSFAATGFATGGGGHISAGRAASMASSGGGGHASGGTAGVAHATFGGFSGGSVGGGSVSGGGHAS